MNRKRLKIAKSEQNIRFKRGRIVDPYNESKTIIEATFCIDCKALFLDGQWQWTINFPDILIESTCPACQRIKDHTPAGYLKLNGRFFAENYDEIISLVIDYASTITEQKPLSRIINILVPEDGTMQVSFTDINLPLAIGDAMIKAFQGKLDFNLIDGDRAMCVNWER